MVNFIKVICLDNTVFNRCNSIQLDIGCSYYSLHYDGYKHVEIYADKLLGYISYTCYCEGFMNLAEWRQNRLEEILND